ncbi:putative bifunctional diguanylate cyclase/phosphodiesterase [Leucobacter massiliensis]|uniref:GGDEF-domain containing protein n=1 Tax=Leucobacter massiliensis TaxID=1686285 RepID=A0A2S9QQU6_9MICO|nr:EAL domain-containing protein [Leucobacter massiliensis]PRI11955.1 hypothetical protein B4915_02455 [Leucobacter massiliensis]
MFTGMDVAKRGRLVAVPLSVVALGAVGYGAYRLAGTASASWTLVLAMVVSVIICSPFQLRIGRSSEAPRIGVAVALLAANPAPHEPFLGACIWTVGLLISQLFTRRGPVAAFRETGIGALSAFAFVAVQTGLQGAGAWPALGYLGAAVASSLVALGLEALQHYANPEEERGFGPSEISAVRLGLATLVIAGVATAMHHIDADLVPWLEGDAQASRPAVLLVLTASVFYVIAQRRRYAGNQQRLTELVDAAVALPRASGEQLAAELRRRAKAIVAAREVTLRAEPPAADDIGASVRLDAHDSRYLVASAKVGGAPFSREDEHALGVLAHVASEASRSQDEVDLLERRANTDPLTGLPNYGAFERALVEANEFRAYHPGIALLFLDIDNFKELNDTHGHRAGDELLRVIGDRLQGSVGSGDFVSRVGGDEFVVILTGLVSQDQAKATADRLLERVVRPLAIEGRDIRPQLSAGLAYSSHRELDARTLVEDADRTMLQAKRLRREGPGGEPLGVTVSSHRSTRTNDIVARAIRENRLGLAFQPIVNIEQGQIWAFEALVRYIDPELGPISPPSLVARAKGLGLMNELTRQVIDKALDAAEEFRRLEPSIGCMTVNLELGQISDDELGAFIRDSVAAHPDISLCVELNERSLRGATDELRRDAELMQRSGVIIALDDYGSDDSPVGALVHFPMNILKIDKSLISNLDDIRQREVIRALQGFGDSLNHTVVVEGIENQAMADVLVELGVRSAQGYFFGRPASFAHTMERIQKWSTRASIS